MTRNSYFLNLNCNYTFLCIYPTTRKSMSSSELIIPRASVIQAGTDIVPNFLAYITEDNCILSPDFFLIQGCNVNIPVNFQKKKFYMCGVCTRNIVVPFFKILNDQLGILKMVCVCFNVKFLKVSQSFAKL